MSSKEDRLKPDMFWLVDGSCEPATDSLPELFSDPCESPDGPHEVFAAKEVGLMWVVRVPPRGEDEPDEYHTFDSKYAAERFLAESRKRES